MKTIILLAVLMTMIVMPAYTQYLEHFTVDSTDYLWEICPTFDSDPQSGVNGFARDETASVTQLVKSAVKTLPEEIKQVLIKYNVRLTIFFNAKGESFYLFFLMSKKDKFPLNDEQWLKVYHTFRHLKIDLSKLELLDNFEWGAGTYPLNRYLQSK